MAKPHFEDMIEKNIYSTNEKQIGWYEKSNGTLVPLFRRELRGTFGTITDGTYSTLEITFDTTIDELMIESAVIKTADTYHTYPFQLGSNTQRISASSTKMFIQSSSSNHSNCTAKVIAKYTKA